MKYAIILNGSCIAIGLLVGIFASHEFTEKKEHHRPPPIEMNKSDFSDRCRGHLPLLSQTLRCDREEDLNTELVSFQDKLEEIKNKAIKNGEATEVAVYFRDLNNGPWFGTDVDKSFTPASLFKLPIAISVYRTAEYMPGLLDEKITYSETLTSGATQNIPPQKTAELGKTYTVEDLVEKMLIYSDNTSTLLLINNLKPKIDFDKIFTDLGIDVDRTNPTDIGISVKSFAGLYRMLFNASYLNKTNSQKLLEILSRSTEEKTLFAGVPDSVPIAAKFGERAYTDKKTKYLHNCGIIYYPKHPYLLCIMTQGTDQANQSKIIEDLSRTIYKEVDFQYKNQGMAPILQGGG